jgi:hypothetical protein
LSFSTAAELPEDWESGCGKVQLAACAKAIARRCLQTHANKEDDELPQGLVLLVLILLGPLLDNRPERGIGEEGV